MPRRYAHVVERLHEAVEGSVEIDGKKVHYAKSGHGPNVVLCLPGELGCWNTDWKWHLEWVDADTFTLVAIDLPGYGKSRPPDREYHKNINKDDADVAHALMADLNLCPYNIFAWGESARTALYMATNENKANVKKMVVWGMQVNLTLQGARIYENCRNMRDFCMRQFLRRAEHYGELWLQDIWKKYCEFNAKIYKEDRGQMCQDVLKQVEQPVLLLHGDRDRIPRYYVDSLKNQLKDCKGLYVHEEGYHDVHNEFRDWFWERVRPFLLDEKMIEEEVTKEQANPDVFLNVTEATKKELDFDRSLLKADWE